MATLCTPAGVSGAFLLLPIQVQLLGVPSPAVSATNLIYNVVATPTGVVTYARQGRLETALVRGLLVGAAPGMVLGAMARTTWFADDAAFAWPAAILLGLLGTRLLLEAGGLTTQPDEPRTDLPPVARLLLIGAVAGAVGGVYGIGGAALAAPWLVGVERLAVTRVAGAALAVTFTTSCIGLVAFGLGAAIDFGTPAAASWPHGLALGAGGVLGTITGAQLQRHLPVRFLRVVLGVTALAAAFRMLD